jgi:hypothetical protein
MRILFVLAFFVLAAAQPVGAREISTDVTVDLSGTLAADEDVVEDVGAAPARIDLGALPENADLIGYSVAPGGDVLFTLDTTVLLPGGLSVTPRDVVRYNGANYTIELRGADRGIPVGAKIDAIGVLEGDLLLSFDVTVAVGGITAADEDLLRLETTQPDVWSLLFDGSARGIPAGADLDGADAIDGTSSLALSFDIAGTVGGVSFADEDILGFDRSSQTWSRIYDGSARHGDLVAADVDALFVPELVPEPDAARLGLAVLVALATLCRRASAARRDRKGSFAVAGAGSFADESVGCNPGGSHA